MAETYQRIERIITTAWRLFSKSVAR